MFFSRVMVFPTFEKKLFLCKNKIENNFRGGGGGGARGQFFF